MARRIADFVRVFYKAIRRWWSEGNTFQFGAAIAYYAIFALTPLAVISVAIAGWLFGETAAQGELANQIEIVVGPTLAQAIQESISRAHKSNAGILATLIGFGIMVAGAMGVFWQLQQALNFIWGVKLNPNRGFLLMAWDNVIPFFMVLTAGALLVLALLASTLLAYVGDHLNIVSLPGGLSLWLWIDWLVSLFLLTLHFAMIFKILPAVRIAWSVVWLGALVTALLFALGNYLIGHYLVHLMDASAFGAAGSLVMVLIWVYYSSQVVLFGAELTRAYAIHFGKPIMPGKNAQGIPR
jgi:membrane protein